MSVTVRRSVLVTMASMAVIATACGGSSADTTAAATTTDSQAGGQQVGVTGSSDPVGAIDITDVVFVERSGDCAAYDAAFQASVNDISRSIMFEADVVIEAGAESCRLASNSIPNHDFDDASAHFADDVAEVARTFTIPRNPRRAAAATPLSQRLYNGVMLNGVPIDLLSAGCYRPDDPMADRDGNVAIGCTENDPWLLDPLGTGGGFGVDEHNAHTQPGGEYHYHGNPHAMFDDDPGPEGSPVIGFAADGFPIFGSYFLDPDTGQVRKAVSGYTLEPGARPDGDGAPGGVHDGMYVDDWEFTGSGDLDECNGMTVNGQYGYYVTDAYPWIMACHSGTPDPSFSKGG